MTKMIKRVIASVLTLAVVGSVSVGTVYAQNNTTASASKSTVQVSALKDNGSKLSSGSVWANGTVTATARFTGGTAPYQYKYSLKENGKDWSYVSSYLRSATHQIKVPNKAGNYTVRIAVLDANKKYQSRYVGLTVKKDTKKALTKGNSTINSVDAYSTGKITVNAKFSGGVQPYRYAYSIKPNGKDWTYVSGYGTANSKTLTVPKKAGRYVIRAAVKDAKGTYQSKYLHLRVVAPKKLDYGTKIQLTVPNEGKNAKYSYAYRNDKNSAWRTLKKTTTSRNIAYRPDAMGKNYIRVIADDNGRACFCDYTYTTAISQAAKDELKLVNRERKKVGLAPLVLDEKMTFMANIRAEEIETAFSHTRPNGTSCFTIFDEYGLEVWATGENIAYGYPTAKDVTEGWMNSPGHRENILRENFNKIGIGKNGTYWTQIFAQQ